MRVNLKSRDGYDIACGMRGPDGPYDLTISSVKYFCSAVIRSLAGLRSNKMGSTVVSVTRAMRSVPDPSVIEWINSINGKHYQYHFEDALNALCKDPVVGKRAKKYAAWCRKHKLIR